MRRNEIITGDALAVLRTLEDGSAQCCVTSPPYWGLRDYGIDGQVGREEQPCDYIATLVSVFSEVRRVLAADGTLWLNLGDSYANDGKWGGETGGKQAYLDDANRKRVGRERRHTGLKPKDLVGIPWAVAFALRDDGWYLRADIIWSKPNVMPESVQDRPTKAHEYLFLLAKSERYFYDAAAIREPQVCGDHPRNGVPGSEIHAPGQPRQAGMSRVRSSGNKERHYPDGNGERPADHLASAVPWTYTDGKRNRRTVWTISTYPYPEAHFATFPEDLPRLCILAGSRPGDVVLDPFAGAGTTCVVADAHQRGYVGIELNPGYADMARRRVTKDGAPLFSVAK